MALPLMKRVKTRLQYLILPLLAIALVPESGIAQPISQSNSLQANSPQANSVLSSNPQPDSTAMPPQSMTSSMGQTITAQATAPMDFLDQPEGVINCVATGTSNAVPWDHRFTYWLSGIAQFDEQGNMQPIPASRSKDWLLTITNSRFPAPTSYHLNTLGEQSNHPRFSFPAVSQEEWERLGKQPSRRYTTAFSYEEASHGLYVAIRNTEAAPTSRQMFQVIHYLADDVAIRTEASPCFIGPRPPSPLELSSPLEGTEPRNRPNVNLE